MPARSEIDPLDLRFCLGWVCIVDVEYAPGPRFRFRLDGSKLVDLTGFDLTGKYIDQIESEDYRQLSAMVYGTVVNTKAPLFLGNMEDWLDRGLYMESVTLPLSDNGAYVTGVMEVICPAVAEVRRLPGRNPWKPVTRCGTSFGSDEGFDER